MMRFSCAWDEATVTLLDQSDSPLAEGATQGWMNKFEITAGGYSKEQCKTLKLVRGARRIFWLNYEISDAVAIEDDLSVGENGVLQLAGETADVSVLIHVDDEV